MSVSDLGSGDVTALIPTIPPRAEMLTRALESVHAQTRQPDHVQIEIDEEGLGPAAVRNRGMEHLTTEWVAFLDDDDEWLPWHLERCLQAAQESGADLVYPLYTGINTGLFTRLLNRPFDEILEQHLLTQGNFIPVTVMARTAAIREVGGFSPHPSAGPFDHPCEDWCLWTKLLRAGYKFHHLPLVTWRWNGHGAHTSGHSWKKPGAYHGV